MGGDGGVCHLPWIRKIKVFSSKYFCFWNNQFSSAAQRRPRPIHKNAKFGAHPSSPPLGFNMAWGGRQKKSFKKTLEMSCNEFNKKSLTPPPLRGWSGGKINCVQEILEMSWNEKKLLGGGGREIDFSILWPASSNFRTRHLFIRRVVIHLFFFIRSVYSGWGYSFLKFLAFELQGLFS